MSIYNVSIIFDYRDHRRRRYPMEAQWTTTLDRRERQDLFHNHPPHNKVWTPRIQVSFLSFSFAYWLQMCLPVFPESYNNFIY